MAPLYQLLDALMLLGCLCYAVSPPNEFILFSLHVFDHNVLTSAGSSSLARRNSANEDVCHKLDRSVRTLAPIDDQSRRGNRRSVLVLFMAATSGGKKEKPTFRSFFKVRTKMKKTFISSP